jgi:zinc transport system substrate-binding protein
MKWRLMLILSAVAAVAGCAPEEPRSVEGRDNAEPTTIGVVEVSNEPLAWVVGRLAAPLVEVRFRAAAAPDPAYWRPSAEDVLAMQQADLIVLNGASYERWLTNVSLPPSRLVDTTAKLEDRLITIAGSVTHSHGPEGKHEHTGIAFTTWLDPTMLIEQARAVRVALGVRWPENDALFEERFASLTADLEDLDAQLAAATTGAGPVLFSHPVYQYFQRRYGLLGPSVHFEPDEMPEPAQWTELDHLLSQQHAAWMIWEADPIPAIHDGLAQRGCGIVVVSPCATPPPEGDFLDVMRRNAAALRTALQPSK